MASTGDCLVSGELLASVRQLCASTHSMDSNDGGTADVLQAMTNAVFFDMAQVVLPRLLDEVELVRHMLMHPEPGSPDGPWAMYIDTDQGRQLYDPTNRRHVMMMLWYMHNASINSWKLGWEEWEKWHAGGAVDT